MAHRLLAEDGTATSVCGGIAHQNQLVRCAECRRNVAALEKLSTLGKI
jgi:hypothetical protein